MLKPSNVTYVGIDDHYILEIQQYLTLAEDSFRPGVLHLMDFKNPSYTQFQNLRLDQLVHMVGKENYGNW